MPVLDVEIVFEPGEELKSGLATDLAEAAAEIFQSGPQQTWVKLRPLPLAWYAENGGSGDNVKPVFISILKARQPSLAQMEAEIHQLTQKFALICNRPAEHIHILYLPDGYGRIAFGGRLLGSEKS